MQQLRRQLMYVYIDMHIAIAMTVDEILRWLRELGRKLGRWPQRRRPLFG